MRARRAAPRRGPGILRLLVGVHLLVLLVPISAITFLDVYQSHLVRQTERRLISESALIAEAWREVRLDAEGRDGPGRIQPKGVAGQFFPFAPVIDLNQPVELPEAPVFERRPLGDGPDVRAARAIAPILNRAKLINLSGARLLDADGCVIASTGAQLGDCLYHLPEVRVALKGRYSAVARYRYSDEPPPSVTSISRRGHLRVFTAMPVLRDGAVIGVVRMSRTALSPLEALWEHRDALLWALIGSLLFTGTVTLWFSRSIARPVQEITRAAQAVAKGARRRPLPRGRVFAEVYDLSAALDEMTDQLRERADYIAEFAANVSHELKTPITSIKGAAELLEDMGEEMSEAQRQRFLSNITAGAERMERLVTRLLYLARVEHADPPAEPHPWRPTLEALIARLGPEEIALEVEERAPERALIEPHHLEDALSNLITNALKAGAPVEIRVEGEAPGLRFAVRDHGAGISEKNQARIFDRFFTTRRDEGGTGLGLSIVRAIARKHGGDVTFISSPEGCTFTFSLGEIAADNDPTMQGAP